MRREGRQRGWVRSYVRFSGLTDPEKARHAVHVVDGAAAAIGAYAGGSPCDRPRGAGGAAGEREDFRRSARGSR